MQTKKQSLKESITNIVVGYFISLISQLIIFPLLNITVTMADNLLISAYFTLISLIRSYVIRRYFNRKIEW